MAIRNVVLLGADGKLGPAVLDALVQAKSFTITVLKRQSSSSPSNYPAGVKVARVTDSFPHDELVAHFKGQDAIVVTVPAGKTDVQKKLAAAAISAGVQRFIPADFGSCDSASPRAQELIPVYYRAKAQLREHLERLASENEAFTWTSIVCGHFFDWSLDFLHFYVKERRADLLDGGETKASLSTLAQIGRGVVGVLRKPDETKNRAIFMQSFCVTQKEVLAALEKVTGQSWQLRHVESAAFEKEEKAKAEQGSHDAIEDLVWMLGALESNWEGKEDFEMELLGLRNEDLESAVKAYVEKL